MDKAEYLFTKIARDSTYVRPKGYETDPKYFLNTGAVTSENLKPNVPWLLKDNPKASSMPLVPKAPGFKDYVKKALGKDITNSIKTLKDKIF